VWQWRSTGSSRSTASCAPAADRGSVRGGRNGARRRRWAPCCSPPPRNACARRTVRVRKWVPVDLGRVGAANGNRHLLVRAGVAGDNHEGSLASVPHQRHVDRAGSSRGEVDQISHGSSVGRGPGEPDRPRGETDPPVRPSEPPHANRRRRHRRPGRRRAAGGHTIAGTEDVPPSSASSSPSASARSRPSSAPASQLS
jgi:hypothetical protein